MKFLEIPIEIDENLDEMNKADEMGIEVDEKVKIVNCTVALFDDSSIFFYEKSDDRTTLTCDAVSYIVALPYNQLRLLVTDLYKDSKHKKGE